jgi:2-methylcitrate dehydratase PrpD
MPGAANAFRNANMPALNLKYLFAIILRDGRLDFTAAQSRQRMEDDSAVHVLMSKVEVVEDESQETPKGEARRESARVIIEETSGKRHEMFVPYVKGYPSHPMTREDVELKAVELIEPNLGKYRAEEIVKQVHRLEMMGQMKELINLIAG